MANCDPYDFTENFTICIDGAIDDVQTANLSVTSNSFRNFVNGASVEEMNWDGTEVVLDLLTIVDGTSGTRVPEYGSPTIASGTGCALTAATLTITPDGPAATSGTMTLEFTIDNCFDASTSTTGSYSFYSTTGYVACGGFGPHTVTQMTTFSIVDGGCAVAM